MARATQELFLQIGGSADGITAASKAGRTALLNLGGAAESVAEEVRKAFDDLGKGSIETSAKDIERTYNRTFAAIRANAEQALAEPTSGGAAKILNLAGSEAAAAAAERQAGQLRILADASAIVAQRAGEAGLAERTLAVGFEAQAVQAERAAIALRAQVGVLAAVHGELGAAAVATDEVAHGSGRMSIAQMEMMHVVRASSDAFAAGAPIMQIFSMEIGRVAEAAAMSGDALGTVGKFLGTGWGMAITAGIAVLGPLVAKLFEESDAAKEAAKATEEHKQAIDALVEAEKHATESAEAKLKADFDQANAERHKAIAIRETTAALLEQAIQQKKALREAALAEQQHGKGEGASTAFERASGNVDALETQLGQNQAAVDRLTKTTVQAETVRIKHVADAESTPEGKVKRRYDLLEAAAEKEAEGSKDFAKYRATLQRLDVARQAELKALQDARSAARAGARDGRQSGRQIDLSQAEGIVHGIGGVVTSDHRSRAEQQRLYDRYLAGNGPLAAKPGTSLHETDQALDIRKTVGMTLGKIAKAFEAQGVHLTEKLDEGDHFHVAWGKKGPSQETIDKRNDAAAQKKIRDDEGYAQLLGRAQEQHLALLNKQITDIAASAELDAAAVLVERQRQVSAAQAGVAEKKWSQGKADQLIMLADENADLKIEQIRRMETHDLLQEHLAADLLDLDGKKELLQIQGRLALTRKDQLDVDLQMLALQEEILRKQANAVLADPTASQTAKDKATAQLKAIDDQHAGKVKNIENDHLDPMQSYSRDLTKGVGDMDDALKGVEVDGIKGVESGLLGIADGTETVAGAFKKMALSVIADLERIALERVILSFIGGFAGGTVPGHATGNVPGFATGVVGGVIHGPGNGVSDSILAFMGNSPIRISNGESIMTEAATRRYGPMLKAMNDNHLPGFATGIVPSSIRYSNLPDAQQLQRTSAASGPPIIFDLRGALTTEHVLAQMNTIAARYSTVSIVAGSNMAMSELADKQSQAIP